MDITEIDEKIENLQQQLNAILAEANRQIGMVNGQIQTWQEVRALLTEAPEASENGTSKKAAKNEKVAAYH